MVGLEQYLHVFRQGLEKVKTGTGSVLLISGESGMGKSVLLEYFEAYVQKNEKGISAILTECHTPIGNFKIGKMQALYAFSKAIEYLLESRDLSPEKRLAKNFGLTALAVIPLIGDVFYAVKEIGKDWRQFKKEKSSENVRKVSHAAADYYDTLCSFADRKPLVLMIDDMHWSDAQSVELFALLTEKIAETSIMLIATYKESDLQNHGLPFLNYITKATENKNVGQIQLEPFVVDYVRDLCKDYFANYKRNDEFERWIFEHSSGVPGVVVEYLKYFSQYPPFSPDGNLVMNFEGNEFLPSTAQSVFSQHLETLTDEERNLLAICSAEGREFTANIVSHLFNLDVLTTIKKLRSLQSKTGIIKSIGAQVRYGVKTTVYKFTQAFYHSFFENSLEYEEYTALHGQIAALLKQKFEATEDEAIRSEIAPYLAAHSSESGDEITAHDMIILAAKSAANKYGSNEIVKDLRLEYEQISDKENRKEYDYEFDELIRQTDTSTSPADNGISDVESATGFSLDTADFKLMRKSIINDILRYDYNSAGNKLEHIINSIYTDLSYLEKIQVLTLSAKCSLAQSSLVSAENKLARALDLLATFTDPTAEAIVFVNTALYHNSQGNMGKAFYYLDKATKISLNLPAEIKLLILSAIAIVIKKSSPEKSVGYYEAARKLSKSLNFEYFGKELSELVV